MNGKRATSFGGVCFRIVNSLLLIGVVAVLVYDVKVTSDLQKRQTEQQDRQKRSVEQSRDLEELYTSSPDDDVFLQSQVAGGGAIYTRWGRTYCEGPDVKLVYAGVVGGSHYNHHGGGSNYLCMPMDPLWNNYNAAVNNLAIVYGAEYQVGADSFPFSPAQKLQDNDVPCAVCRVTTRPTVISIPARNQCYDGWVKEYDGYLMAGHHTHKGRFQFVCMDKSAESDPSGYRNDDGALFYPSEGACGSLPCPPYEAGKELTCVVCSK